jgi:peptide chain release factor 3
LLGAVGPLQYEVLQYRLKDEYGVDSNLNPMPWKILRWVENGAKDQLLPILPNGAGLACDDQDRLVMLFPSEWSLKYFKEIHPTIVLVDSPSIKNYQLT